MSEDKKLVQLRGGKSNEPPKPRAARIIVTIPDVDDTMTPVHLTTEGAPVSLPEVVFNLMTAANMLMLARPMPEGD